MPRNHEGGLQLNMLVSTEPCKRQTIKQAPCGVCCGMVAVTAAPDAVAPPAPATCACRRAPASWPRLLPTNTASCSGRPPRGPTNWRECGSPPAFPTARCSSLGSLECNHLLHPQQRGLEWRSEPPLPPPRPVPPSLATLTSRAPASTEAYTALRLQPRSGRSHAPAQARRPRPRRCCLPAAEPAGEPHGLQSQLVTAALHAGQHGCGG